MSGVESMRTDGPTQIGTRLTFHTRGKDRDATIAACEPQRMIVLRSVQGNITADYTYSLQPVGDARTKVRLVADCSAAGFMGLLAPLLRMAMKLTDGGQVDKLKSFVEMP